MMQMINNSPPHERELSVSFEGSDIVFEDLLGDLSQNKKKKAINGNQKPKLEPVTIEDLFDDIFDIPIEESERTSIFTDDEEEESVEGWDPNNTTFVMPSDDDTDNIDVLDSILQDLDEKTKEIEKNKNKKQKSNTKKNKKNKKKAPKQKPAPSDPSNPAPSNPSNSFRPKPIAPSITVPIEENEASAINEDTKLRLEGWEFDDKLVRKDIRILLSTLSQILPECVEYKWKAIKMSNLLNDGKIRKQYFNAIRIVHPDKSIGRGDDMETKMICNYIFQALEQAYSKHAK